MKRFLRWDQGLDRFRNFAGGKKEWKDVVGLLPPEGTCRPPTRRRLRQAAPALRGERLPSRRVYGEVLNFENMHHAPRNEMGVIYLFGLMAKGLGFMIESIQNGFPDCEAKRMTAKDEWQLVRIEFEYESRNFREHGHAAEGCDIIVCWEHNWEDCPKNIEVIALKEEIERLAGSR